MVVFCFYFHKVIESISEIKIGNGDRWSIFLLQIKIS